MFKKKFKILMSISCVMLLSMSLIGCNGGDSSDDSSSGITQINMAIVGDQPKHIDQFYKKLDALTEKDLKIKVRFQNISWQDVQNKYNLALTSGNLDIIPSGSWLNYSDYAKKNAFLDISDLVKKDAPDMYKKISKNAWSGAKIDGKIYGVPQDSIGYGNALGIQYREDLRKKYNLPEIKDMNSLENYLLTLKKNETSMPYMLDQQDFVANYEQAATGLTTIDSDGTCTSSISQYGLLVDPKNTSKSVLVYDTPGYKDLVKTMKKWYDEGLVNKNILSTKDQPEDMMRAGSLPADFISYFVKSRDLGYKIEKIHPNWELGFWLFTDKNVYNTRTGHTLESITRNSKHPDLALKFLNKIRTDRNYFDLMSYGIKDTNYSLTSQGKVDVSKVSDDNVFSLTPCWGDAKFDRRGTNEWSKSEPINQSLAKISKDNPLNGFYFDTSKVQTEIANMEQVRIQYIQPIQVGISQNPESDLKAAVQKLKDAGLDKVQAEVDRQLKEFSKKAAK
ncbi:ABC transporter substrate-binding protein [Clostridium felsineum]|uniref:ABC transporter substrate-binding protein n=1 Tax=Clostridium felsineum TaxID=36839 RepID=UPI00098CED16|nr:extracellular solute-binding protein [Clostridium felsineum]URZ01232.1 hypothetical protein CLAUR_012210 [Clostridium felsineum]